jgi:hypothetical protein
LLCDRYAGCRIHQGWRCSGPGHSYLLSVITRDCCEIFYSPLAAILHSPPLRPENLIVTKRHVHCSMHSWKQNTLNMVRSHYA